MRLIINGQPCEHEPPLNLDELVRSRTQAPETVAVLLNNEAAPRARWPETSLQEGDRLELLTLAGGG